jgi:hypothetical protein
MEILQNLTHFAHIFVLEGQILAFVRPNFEHFKLGPELLTFLDELEHLYMCITIFLSIDDHLSKRLENGPKFLLFESDQFF